MSIYVFVYGTLRAGEINDLGQAAAARGLPAAQFVGPATVPGRLVDFGEWPGLIPVSDGRRVRGDVYLADPALIALLDEIEEYSPERLCCFVRREVAALLDPPDPGTGQKTGQLLCQYYPIDPAFQARAIDISGDDWVVYRRERATVRPPVRHL